MEKHLDAALLVMMNAAIGRTGDRGTLQALNVGLGLGGTVVRDIGGDTCETAFVFLLPQCFGGAQMMLNAGNEVFIIHTAFRMVLDRAGNNAKLTLLRAHPDLAGKLAVSGELAEESTSEQASADLGNCTPEEFEAFQSLNNEYKERFGFPFILAVRGYHRTEILETFRDRVNNDWETEFKTALEQVHRIALLRLNDIA